MYDAFDFGSWCPPGSVARRDLEAVLAGAYDVPVKDAKLVLDVGANVGAFSAWALTRWPSADVWAFEPSPRAFGVLCRNLKEHKGERWGGERLALSDAGRTVTLYGGKWTPGESSLELGPEQNGRETWDVETFRGDEMCGRTPDVVKIDTEGHELPVLRGMSRWLADVKAIMLELHHAGDEREVARMLEPTHALWSREVQFGRPDRLVVKYIKLA